MTKDADRSNVFVAWYDKIDARQRVKALCKPCWEIKYCPYGPLVEQFPLPEARDERSCRIFGHDCPVFHVAEPFTETKELRNISRSIPRATQFRVLKRENQVCRHCNVPVKDDDTHFDHIIPWSKGGSSDEHNVQLLCGACNRKKSNKFEEEHLVESFRDHVVEPANVDVLDYLFFLIDFCHDFRSNERRLPNADDFAKQLNNDKKTWHEEQGAQVIEDLDDFFHGPHPQEIPAAVFNALRWRWGFDDNDTHFLRAAADKFAVGHDDLLTAETSLVNRLGWRVSLNKTQRNKWLRS